MINRRSISALAVCGVLGLGTAGAAQARHGADDPVGHHANDDRGQRHGGHGADDRRAHRARHGRGRRNDDGPNHT
jgi:hypothetical protein